jgi:Na+/melibiose symporter-like transporter
MIGAYCAPVLWAGCAGMLTSIYLMKFSTDVLLVGPAAMGVIYGAGRIWDAISDPLAGHLSDRSTARRCSSTRRRRRPS